MKAKTSLNHILKKLVSVTSCVALLSLQPIYAQENPAPQETQETTQESSAPAAQAETQEESSDLEGQTSNEANYCMDSPKAEVQNHIKSCEKQNLKYNCHLQRCVSHTDNEIYNEEYNDCNAYSNEAERNDCKDNLKSVTNEIDSHNANVADNKKTANQNKKTGMMENAGLAVDAGMTVYLGMILLTDVPSPTCISGNVSLGVSALALMYKLTARDKYKAKFKAAVNMMKNIDKSDKKGWNHNTQVATVDMEIKALKLIKEAAEEKMKYHNTLKTMSAVTLTIATTEAIICSMPYSGCSANVPCAIKTAAFSAAGLALEMQAYNGIKEKRDDAAYAIQEATKLRTKLQSLYNIDKDSMIMQNPQLAASGVGRLQMAKINTLGNSFETPDGKQPKLKSCMSKEGEPSTCPCAGGACKKFSFDLPGNSGLEASVAKKLGLQQYEQGMNSTANGNTNGLDFASDPKRLALASAVNDRLLKKALSMKELKKYKDTLQNIKDGVNSAEDLGKLANIASPIQSAALAHSLGYSSSDFGMGKVGLGDVKDKTADAQEKANKDDAKKAKATATFAGKSSLSDLQKRLKALQDGLNLDDLEGLDVDSTNNKLADGELVDKGLKSGNLEVDTEQAVVHPDEKISIFKIITNRYNILRAKKRFAK